MGSGKRMKYILSLFLACILLFSWAIAEQSEYRWVCYGDEAKAVGILAAIIGYNGGEVAEDVLFDDGIYNCLVAFQEENGLEASGCFDFETLCYIFDILPDTSDANIVWIPMNGGKKYHDKDTCSNMIEPRQVPKGCVQALELDACKKCYKLKDIEEAPED